MTTPRGESRTLECGRGDHAACRSPEPPFGRCGCSCHHEGRTATKYRSRPIEVEAMQWTGGRDSAVALRSWMDQEAHQHGLGIDFEGHASLWVKKSNRWVEICRGDYVVAEPDGDGFYPCVKAIFEDRYYDELLGDHG